MLKKLLFGALLLLLIVAIGIWQAPARLAATALANNPNVPLRLLGARGTLWNGSAEVLVNKIPVGTLSWQLRPTELLRLQAAADWQLSSADYSLSGSAAAESDRYHLRDVTGRFGNRFLTEQLARYDIAPGGDLTITNLQITDVTLNAEQTWPATITASGQAEWSGGAVYYRLAGQDFNLELPPLQAVIETPSARDPAGGNAPWPQMRVTAQGSDALLLTGRLTPRGSAAIGITRGLTRLAGQPWPGSDPDHAIVLEVEEQLN